jgi:hypothetical protein
VYSFEVTKIDTHLLFFLIIDLNGISTRSRSVASAWRENGLTLLICDLHLSVHVDRIYIGILVQDTLWESTILYKTEFFIHGNGKRII